LWINTAKTGQIERALELLPTIQPIEQKAIALATIAGRLTAQQPQQATPLYAEAVSTARSTLNANQVIANVALRYVETGDWLPLPMKPFKRSLIRLCKLRHWVRSLCFTQKPDRKTVLKHD
jgi:hypothetical protein